MLSSRLVESDNKIINKTGAYHLMRVNGFGFAGMRRVKFEKFKVPVSILYLITDVYLCSLQKI